MHDSDVMACTYTGIVDVHNIYIYIYIYIMYFTLYIESRTLSIRSYVGVHIHGHIVDMHNIYIYIYSVFYIIYITCML
jgi:hypothetical protein